MRARFFGFVFSSSFSESLRMAARRLVTRGDPERLREPPERLREPERLRLRLRDTLRALEPLRDRDLLRERERLLLRETLRLLRDPLRLLADPLRLRRDPLRLRRDPLRLLAEPLRLLAEPLRLRRDPLRLLCEPLWLRLRLRPRLTERDRLRDFRSFSAGECGPVDPVGDGLLTFSPLVSSSGDLGPIFSVGVKDRDRDLFALFSKLASFSMLPDLE